VSVRELNEKIARAKLTAQERKQRRRNVVLGLTAGGLAAGVVGAGIAIPLALRGRGKKAASTALTRYSAGGAIAKMPSGPGGSMTKYSPGGSLVKSSRGGAASGMGGPDISQYYDAMGSAFKKQKGYRPKQLTGGVSGPDMSQYYDAMGSGFKKQKTVAGFKKQQDLKDMGLTGTRRSSRTSYYPRNKKSPAQRARKALKG